MGSVGANRGTVNNPALRNATDEQLRMLQTMNASNPNVIYEIAQEVSRRQDNRATRISQAKFTEEGNGNWQMDIPDIGGGQVLDETGSTRAYREGFMPNAKVYSASAWTYDENGTPTVTDLGTFNRRNQAQTAIRNLLKGNRRI